VNRKRAFRLGPLSATGGLAVTLMEGDIAQVETDVLVIRRVAVDMIHDQVRLPLSHNRTVVANTRGSHHGAFNDLVFVIEDRAGPLRTVIGAALEAADQAGCRKVSLPAGHDVSAPDGVGKDIQAVANETVHAIFAFAVGQPKSLTELTLVTHGKPEMFTALAREMAEQDALSRVERRCRMMISGGRGGGSFELCDKPVGQIGVVDHKNLVCDRLVVATCPDGHEQNIAIDDED
jgi:hypothetical protein